VNRFRMMVSLAVLGLLAVGVLFVKLPRHVVCTLEIQPRDAAAVYVSTPGTLVSLSVGPGDRVSEQQRLALLQNTDTLMRIAQLTTARDRYQVKLDNLRLQRHRDPRAGAEIGEIEETLQTINDQLDKRMEDQKRLELTAPAGGTVLPPPWTPPREQVDGRLPAWSGRPLDPANLGCHLQPGTLFCQVGDPQKMEAILVIDQADIELVREGQEVEILLDAVPQQTLRYRADGDRPERLKITEVAGIDLKASPRGLSTKVGGDLPTRTDAAGIERPISTSYQARVPLDNPDGVLRSGLRGTARIHADSQTIAQRLRRLVEQTVNFRL
jgi:putative peptide zinc metalloprotease protein